MPCSPSWGESIQSFTIKDDSSCKFTIDTLYQISEEDSFKFAEHFFSWINVEFCQIFFCIYRDAHMLFLLYLLICWITWIDIWMLNQSSNPVLKPILSWCIIFCLCIIYIQFANILWRSFVSVFMNDVILWFSLFVSLWHSFGITVIL